MSISFHLMKINNKTEQTIKGGDTGQRNGDNLATSRLSAGGEVKVNRGGRREAINSIASQN